MWHKRLMEYDKFLPNDINPHASAVKGKQGQLS